MPAVLLRTLKLLLVLLLVLNSGRGQWSKESQGWRMSPALATGSSGRWRKAEGEGRGGAMRTGAGGAGERTAMGGAGVDTLRGV